MSATASPDMTPRRTYQAIVEQALAATGAGAGRLLARRGDALTVVALLGATDPSQHVGSAVALQGARAFALSTDQPVALMPAPSDTTNDGVGGWLGVPPSILVAASGSAVLEVAAKAGDGAFTYDDIEAISAFAEIAGAAVEDHGDADSDVAAPAALATGLDALASLDPGRYRDVARAIAVLLGGNA